MECAYHETLPLVLKLSFTMILIEWLVWWLPRHSARFFVCYIKISNLHYRNLKITILISQVRKLSLTEVKNWKKKNELLV